MSFRQDKRNCPQYQGIRTVLSGCPQCGVPSLIYSADLIYECTELLVIDRDPWQLHEKSIPLY